MKSAPASQNPVTAPPPIKSKGQSYMCGDHRPPNRWPIVGRSKVDSKSDIRVQELFEQALALPVTDRGAYLDEACVGGAELRSAVEALLVRHDDPPISELLAGVNDGESGAADRLFERVYDELRQMARCQMAHERPGHTLQPTALVNEAYQRLWRGEKTEFVNRRYFFRAAGIAMERILIDYHRQHSALRRGGGWIRTPMDQADGVEQQEFAEQMAVAEAMQKLKEIDPRKVEVVRLRYFVGLTVTETAEMLNVAPRTVNADWEFARTWLHRELSKRGDG